MSKWSTVKNNNLQSDVRMDLLEEALKGMGVSLDYNVTNISNSWGHETCTAAFVKDNKVLSLGIKVDNEGGISLVGDTWGTGLGGDGKQEQLMNSIAQRYTSELYQEVLTEKGFDVTVETNEEGKLVVIGMQS